MGKSLDCMIKNCKTKYEDCKCYLDYVGSKYRALLEIK